MPYVSLGTKGPPAPSSAARGPPCSGNIKYLIKYNAEAAVIGVLHWQSIAQVAIHGAAADVTLRIASCHDSPQT